MFLVQAYNPIIYSEYATLLGQLTINIFFGEIIANYNLYGADRQLHSDDRI